METQCTYMYKGTAITFIILNRYWMSVVAGFTHIWKQFQSSFPILWPEKKIVKLLETLRCSIGKVYLCDYGN